MERPTDVPEELAPPADQARANDYDSFAEGYSAENEHGFVNAYYERPAMLALAGDVAGRRILDAGCGSGPLSAALRERGAVVTGIDSSAGMLALARRRLGDDAGLHLADLRDPLPFDDGAFDDVVASLVLRYRKPLHAMTDAFTTAGFRLSAVSEPQPHPAARELFPDDFSALSASPCFLFFVLEVPSPADGTHAA
ncbi:class I SAM-dependent methyltransferase [Streptomyces roseus]|uniref:class I SAM-dependent methyltransferase n=1 Tax=Streptomyces roseus TaxID=66430 RepID=UPI0038084B1D